MSGGDIAQILIALATLVTAVGGVLIGLRNTRKINVVHDLTNSLATRTEALAKSTGMAEGNLQGRTEQTAERRAERADRAADAAAAAPPVVPTAVIVSGALAVKTEQDRREGEQDNGTIPGTTPNRPLK